MKDPEDCKYCQRDEGYGVDGRDEGRCRWHSGKELEDYESRKKDFLELLRSKAMPIKEAARKAGCSYQQIWTWRQDDEEFDEKVEEVKKGRQRQLRVEKVVDSMLSRILKGEAAASEAIFWLKNNADWKDQKSLEHSGPDGEPIQTEEVSDEDAKELQDYTEAFRGRFTSDN